MPVRIVTLSLCLTAILLSLADVQAARAQGISMLSPMPPKYVIGGFEYVPPQGDGWRETSSSPDELRIVYAELIDADTINTRVEFWARAFEIEDPAQAPDGFRLALASFEQRKKERGDSLVAHSNIEMLGGSAGIFTYSLVLRVGDADAFEIFYVFLAPDKSGYVAAKFVSRDADYDQQPYFKPFLQSLSTLGRPTSAAVPAVNESSSSQDREGLDMAPEPAAQAEERKRDVVD